MKFRLNKKNKLRRKDKFKEIKKGIVPMSKCPQFMQINWGNMVIADNGIIQFKDKDNNNIFDKMYEVKMNDKLDIYKAIFEILRKYDVSFRICYTSDRVYLRFLFNNNSINDVWVECDNLEKIVLKELNDIGISIVPLNNNDRLKMADQFLTEKSSIIENYIDNNKVINWKPDFEIKSNFQEYDGVLEYNKKKYAMFFINDFSDKISDFIEELRERINVKSIMYNIYPVSDGAVKQFIESNYMGYENALYEIQKKEPQLYDIYMGTNDNDSKYFTLFGILFLCNIETTEELETIKMLTDRYNIKIKFFHIDIVDCFKEFCCIGAWKYSQTRCIKTSQVSEFLAQKKEKGMLEILSLNDLLLDIKENDEFNTQKEVSLLEKNDE